MKNVVFIITDDQRFNTIGALGNPDIKTPNLDALVQSGTAFTNAHIPGGTSGAICMPSRAMLHTGRTLFHIEGEGQNIPSNHTTLAEVLQSAGYTCFGTGKWHNGPPAFARGFTQGKSIFFGGMWDHWNVPTCRFDPTGQYDNEINFVSNFAKNNQPRRVHCDAFSPGVHSSTLLSDTTVEFLQTKQAQQPFFLYLSYLAPHDPRTMPPEFLSLYDPNTITLPDNIQSEHDFLFGVEGIRDEQLIAYPRTQDDLRRELSEYYGMISHLDQQIGRVLTALRESGELQNTLIVFTSDNGLSMGSHGLMGKQNLYEESVRVPLIFSGPGIKKGQRSNGLVYLLDIFPTLCELLDLKIPASVEGVSFCSLFDDPDAETRQNLYFAYNDLLRGVKDRRYKLIEYRNSTCKTQLFDLLNDASELCDISEQYPHIVQRLRTVLKQMAASWENTDHAYSKAFWQSF